MKVTKEYDDLHFWFIYSVNDERSRIVCYFFNIFNYSRIFFTLLKDFLVTVYLQLDIKFK